MGKVNEYPTATAAADADVLLGVQGGALKQFPRSLLAVTADAVLAVSAATGSDAAGTRGRLDRPYRTLTAALAVAQSGDAVVLYPGTYTHSKTSSSGSPRISVPAGVSLHGIGRPVVALNATGNWQAYYLD